MYHIARVYVLGGFEHLVHNVTLMYILEYVAPLYHVVQVSLHVFEAEVDVAVV